MRKKRLQFYPSSVTGMIACHQYARLTSCLTLRRSSLRFSPCFILCTPLPQGFVSGPILFLIFINDLPDKIKSSVRLFADDCVLYKNINKLQYCLILQEDLDGLGLWEAEWQMKFSFAKCQ